MKGNLLKFWVKAVQISENLDTVRRFNEIHSMKYFHLRNGERIPALGLGTGMKPKFLACQVTVQGDITVTKFDGFWGHGDRLIY